MSYKPDRPRSPKAWTPATHRAHTRAELLRLSEAVEATMGAAVLVPGPAPARGPPQRLLGCLTDVEAAQVP